MWNGLRMNEFLRKMIAEGQKYYIRLEYQSVLKSLFLQRTLEKETLKITILTVNKSMDSPDKAEGVPAGYVGCEDLPGFVSAMLDQYKEVNQLSWHDGANPQNEIFIKVGGDHGGDSFKFMLQGGNVKTPN